MSSHLGRREFLKHSAGVAALAASASVVGVPAVLAERSPNSKLNMVCIGANGRGMAHVPVAASEHLVGLVDIDDRRMGATLDWLDKNVPGTRSKVKTYYDYRKMFDEMHKQVDALFIAIPDHSHACATMMAIKLGKHVYCEKPLTHDIYEARALGQAARQYKVMTQMGNQGHASESIRVLREYLEAGAIGTVRETHTWTSQYYGDQVRRPDEPAPAGVHWDEWIGPGPWCHYRSGLHPGGGTPAWYFWKDYGTGLLPCVGVHAFDAAHWGLQLKYPTSVTVIEQEESNPGVWPAFTTLCYEFPRPGLPPLKAYWYGGKRRAQIAKDHDDQLFGAKNLNHPHVADELAAKYGLNLTSCGTIFVGDKGYMYCDEYCGGARIVPEEQHRQFTPPKKKYARTRGIHADFLRAIKEGGDPPSSNFPDVSGPYLEALLVGNLAQLAGQGKKVEWDGANMRCTNLPELNQYVRREYRKGWSL
jgi:predicted dehydrogenase